MMQRSSLLWLALIVALPGEAWGASTPQSTPAGVATSEELQQVDARVQAAVQALEAQGLAVDLAALEVTVRPREELKQLLYEDLTESWGEPRANLYRVLLQSYGRQYAEGQDLLNQLARQRAKGLSVHYLPGRGELCLVRDQIDDQDPLPLLVALAQAARHQAGSPLFTAEFGSFEAIAVREALVGGGAIVDSRRAKGEDSIAIRPLRWLRDRNLVGLDTELQRGGLEAFEQLRSAEALSELWTVGASSSEQLLHANKRGYDEPRSIELPPWPAKLGDIETLHEDTLGEAVITALLVDMGASGLRAQMAATGWDGDRIRHGRIATPDSASHSQGPATADGQAPETGQQQLGADKHVLVWRTVWDRPKDAQAFAQEWRKRAGGQVSVQDRAVDWVLADSRPVWNRILKDLQTRPFTEEVNDTDGASTLAAEEEAYETRRSAPYVVANEWRHPRLDLTVVVPPGWYEFDDEELGTTYMVRTRTAGYRDNVHVTTRAILDGSTIAEVLEVNEQRLRDDPEHEFISTESRMLGDTEVGLLRYQRHEGGHDVIFTTMVILQERRQVGVTIGVELGRWDQLVPVVEQILNAVRLEKVPPMSRNN